MKSAGDFEVGSVLSLLAILVAGCGTSVPSVSSLAAGSKLEPPVIKETFTPLPCPAKPTSTLEFEGCAEKQTLKTDAQIDATVRVVFGLLDDDAARGHLVKGERAWLAYRQASCLSLSDRYAGGTLAPVEFGQCAVARNKTHLSEVKAFERRLRSP
jgi:uncharacterized protein YecT (DUF1311 family)